MMQIFGRSLLGLALAASLFGGQARAQNASIAAVVNGLALIGVGEAAEEIATALVLLTAVTVDSLVRRRGSTT